MAAKCAVLRVTTARSWRIAIAAIFPARLGDAPAPPELRGFGIEGQDVLRIAVQDCAQSGFVRAGLVASPRWRTSSTPRRSSPTVMAER